MKKVFNEKDIQWLAFHMREIDSSIVDFDACGASEGWAPLETEGFAAAACMMMMDIAESFGETPCYSPSLRRVEECPVAISLLRGYGLEKRKEAASE